ncbi:DNA replication/repair protein RecF [Aestuariispira insulae]|uniref:DNA replication and repair protein RecF n=1 Tax=Aestuariispira insulae TaxID=1461337 RepID=A0A3D9HAM5_9PROT|nr:DNA replication/repair protein RecF [Aestuariispira insulae]RED46231.1 DNA replication and repair protein RecF [Aestuariispira insulae]
MALAAMQSVDMQGTMAPKLAVQKLTLSNFRNYVSARLDVDQGPVLLTGENGAGKTNLLEAVSMLAPGRGLRTAKTREMDRAGGDSPWAVSATVMSTMGEVSLGSGREPEGERRLVRINGANARSQAALGEYVNVVWLTPQMDGLFQEGASARRRFLDRLIYGFDSAHAGRLNAYDKTLRERSRLLKEGRADAAWLDALETQMVERGIAIVAARKTMAERLNLVCRKADGPFPGAGVAVTGSLEDWLGRMPALQTEDRFKQALQENRRRDAETGGAAHGPHRSDLEVTHLGKGMQASLCSTGEQKALLISIVLAHAKLQAAELGTAPILLLDEVAAHLDADRRAALFEILLGLNSQSWLTGTEPGVFEGLLDRAQLFRVANATIERIDNNN